MFYILDMDFDEIYSTPNEADAQEFYMDLFIEAAAEIYSYDINQGDGTTPQLACRAAEDSIILTKYLEEYTDADSAFIRSI